MAQTKLFAPEGFHFMVSKDKGFYLMKNSPTGYVKHTLRNGETSSTYVMVDVPSSHRNVRDSFYYNNVTKLKNTFAPKPVKTVKTISTPKATPATTRVVRTVRIAPSSSSSSGGGYSGGGSSGSSGGGY